MEWERIIKEYVCFPCKVAVLGATVETGKPVSGVLSYLKSREFVIYPVNPKYMGLKIFDLDFYSSIKGIPEAIDILLVFIGPKNQGFLLDELKQIAYKPIIWFQPGAQNPQLEEKLKELGYDVVSGECIMAVHSASCR